MRAPVVAARMAKSLTCGIVQASINALTCSRVIRLSRGGEAPEAISSAPGRSGACFPPT